MKIKALVLLGFFLLGSMLIAQEKPDIKKDLKATTEDGRKVLLKTDGTWELIQGALEESWKEVISWKGKGIKNTETFTIKAKEWKVCWTTKAVEFGGIFQIMIYKGDSKLPDIAANVQGADEDCSFMRGTGDYYLTINSTQPWNITVKEKR